MEPKNGEIVDILRKVYDDGYYQGRGDGIYGSADDFEDWLKDNLDILNKLANKSN